MNHIKLFEDFNESVNSVEDFRKLFIKINKDLIKDNEMEVVFPLKDWEYYADQIWNIKDNEGETISHEKAEEIAKQLDPKGEDKSHIKESLDMNEGEKYPKEVTEDRYEDMLGVLPPIYVSELDGKKISGFAVAEPYSSYGNLPTFGTLYKEGGKHWETFTTLKDKNGKDITFATYNSMEFTRGNKATTLPEKAIED